MAATDTHSPRAVGALPAAPRLTQAHTRGCRPPAAFHVASTAALRMREGGGAARHAGKRSPPGGRAAGHAGKRSPPASNQRQNVLIFVVRILQS